MSCLDRGEVSLVELADSPEGLVLSLALGNLELVAAVPLLLRADLILSKELLDSDLGKTAL